MNTSAELDQLEDALLDSSSVATVLAGLSPADYAWVIEHLGEEDPFEPEDDPMIWTVIPHRFGDSEEGLASVASAKPPGWTAGDAPHLGTKPRIPYTISAHGCWILNKALSNPPSWADVTVDLYQHWGGTWVPIDHMKERIPPGCGGVSA